MKLLVAPLLGLTLIGLGAPAGLNISPAPPRPEGAVQLASICVKTGEKVSGSVKSCFYNCGGEGRELKVGSRAICPMTITY